MSTSRRKPFLWPDLIRSLAIYLVLVIHSTTPLTPRTFLWPVQLVLNILSMSAVPLFVMLSGALLLKTQEPTRVFFSKRLSRLLTPWAFWSICTCAFLLGTQETLSVSAIGLVKLMGATLQSFWFLPMIVGLYLLTPLLRILVHAASKQDIAWLIFLWFVGTSLFPYVHDSLAFPRSVDNGLVRQVVTYSGYFLLGWLLTQQRPSNKSVITAFTLSILGIVWAYSATLHTPLTPTGTFSPLQYGYIAPGVVISSVGICMTLWNLGVMWEQTISAQMRTALQSVSTATFGIYLSHLLIRDLLARGGVSLIMVPTTWIGANYIHGVLLFGISVVVITLLRRITPIRKFIS